MEIARARLSTVAATISAVFIATVATFGALDGAQAKYADPTSHALRFTEPVARPAPASTIQSEPGRRANLQRPLRRQEPNLEILSRDPSTFGLLGSVEFKVARHKFSEQWADVQRRIKDERALYAICDDPNSVRCPEKLGRWRKKLDALKVQDKLAQLKELNRFVNHLVSYADDAKVYGKRDHWANPAELLARAGDCEDYAILKFHSLLELGFSNEQLRLAIVRDTKRRLLHAVVSVELDGKTYILDNLYDRPVSHQHILKYVPVYSWNLKDQWAHIVTRNIRIRFVAYMAELA